MTRLVLLLLLLVFFAHAPVCVLAADPLPRHPSELLLIGDSVTAGMYFLGIDQESMSQAWSGQLLRRLGMDVPRAPSGSAYPIDHLKLAKNGFGWTGLAYAWEARRFFKGRARYDTDQERVVIAIPGQTVREVLEQSSDTKDLNRRSSGWTFGKVLLPKHMSVIQTVEAWEKQPRWIVVFIGANDLLASFGMTGGAAPITAGEFHQYYDTLVERLRAKMAPGTPPEQLILLTLPDVTTLPFIQNLPGGSDNGSGVQYPDGSKASAFLIPFRRHFEDREVWTNDELAIVQSQVGDYNAAIMEIAGAGGFTVLDTETLMKRRLAGDPAFSTPYSPYFSPDLHHPSFPTHEVIATAVLDTMASIANEPVPPALADDDTPLPSASAIEGKPRERMNAMMHLAVQGLQAGPLPPGLTYRLALESAAQGGDERVGDVVFSVTAGLELAPAPTSSRRVVRLGLSARTSVAALHASDEDTDFFPKRSAEGRLGMAFEPIGMWSWKRLELGGLMTLDRYRDGGYFVRGELFMFYADVSSRGWEPDRFEIGLRFGGQPRRAGRNGN